MKLENGKISNSQLSILVLSFMQGMILTINYSYLVTEHDTWLVVLAAFPITIIFGVIYTAIIKKFPGKNLIQINDLVFGSIGGKAISVLYIWFFFQLIIHYMYFLNSFWIAYVMPETPRLAFLIMFVFVCAMAVRGGIEVITRCSFLFAVITAASTLIVAVLLLGDIEPSNLLPVIDISPMQFVQSLHITLTIPFCDIVVFLMVLPYAEEKLRIRKPVLIGICLSTAQLLIVVVRDALVLGIRMQNTLSASFAVSRQIEIKDILTRLDVLVAIAMLVTVFMKISIFFYVTVLSTAQTLKLRSYRPLIVPIGALAVAFAVKLYSSDMEQAYAAQYVWPFNAAVYEFVLPIITLIIIAVRKLPKKDGEKST